MLQRLACYTECQYERFSVKIGDLVWISGTQYLVMDFTFSRSPGHDPVMNGILVCQWCESTDRWIYAGRCLVHGIQDIEVHAPMHPD